MRSLISKTVFSLGSEKIETSDQLMPQIEGKPQYFANGDFERTVADIISSPRRRNFNNTGHESLFEITVNQREYYTKCFKHLLKSTQGVVGDLVSSALNGADNQVVEFFKRSGLDTESLSRIWTLSDVNEDGWLDLNEFSMAMHLIVLRVKGEVPIPAVLPAHVRPPRTPPRENSQLVGQISPAIASSNQPASSAPNSLPISNKGSVVGSWDQFDIPDGPSESTNKGEISLTTFSDVPPLLVDSRPTAVKLSLLSLKSPSGPPPQPPPRPAQKGHGRSASLDLKTVTQQSLPVFPSTERRDSDSSAMAFVARAAPPQPLPARPNRTPSGSVSLIPPPVPQRVSPPTLAPPTAAPSMRVAETQTVSRRQHDDVVEQFIEGIGGRMDDLLGCEVAASQGNGVDRWGQRCKALREQNTQLEQERARLAQVRIQLELRLQEIEEKLAMTPSLGNTTKPTAL